MKKGLVFTSCVLLSMPIFAKNFVEHITRVKTHQILQ